MDERQVTALARECPWLDEYMEYTKDTEAPAHFHLLVGLTLMGTALGRRAFFTHGVFKIYPNIYSLLVAPSGRCRKSTAMKIGMDLVHKASLDEIKIVGPKVTPEALIQAAYREKPAMIGGKIVPTFPDSVTLVHAPELAVFLNTRDFNKDIVPILTDLYDSPDKWTTSTIGRGEISLHNVFVSCLGASTLNWLVELVPKSAFGGGYMGRHIIAAREHTERLIPVPIPPSPDLQSSLVVGLQKLGAFQAEITWSEPAYAWFDKWYRGTKEHRENFADDRQAGYMERKPITLIKVAIIKTAASGRTITTKDDLDWARRLLGAMEEDMLSIFSSIGSFESRTFEHQLYERLQGFLKVKKYAEQKSILQHMLQIGVAGNKVREMLNSMLGAGQIDVRRADGKIIYKFISTTPKDEPPINWA